MLTPKSRMESLAKDLGARFRISRRGVPHIVIDREPYSYSVTYFGKTQVYQVFYPYAAGFGSKQTSWDFKSPEAVIQFMGNPPVPEVEIA